MEEWFIDAHLSNEKPYESCICEFEELPMLCKRDDSFWVYEYGKSYWVPPAHSGGKDTGDNFKQFMNPESEYATQWTWLAETMAGYVKVDINPADGEISVSEVCHAQSRNSLTATKHYIRTHWYNVL